MSHGFGMTKQPDAWSSRNFVTAGSVDMPVLSMRLRRDVHQDAAGNGDQRGVARLDDFVEIRPRLLVSALAHVGLTAREPRAHVVLLDRQRLAVRLDRLVVVARVVVGEAELEP